MPLAVEGGGCGGGVGDWQALQMTWQPKLLKRKHGSPPLGLRNLGNSCYLNSVLQCLTYTPPLANFCVKYLHSSTCDLASRKGSMEKKGECPFCILEKRIARSLNSEAVADAPLQMNSCLKIFAEHFRLGRQEDAHEFLRYVIDACHNTCLRLKKLQQQHRGRNGVENGQDVNGTGETVVKDIFGGALRSQIKCLSCGAESNKVDDIMDISLDILHSRSLVEALMNFFEPEILDGNNRYKCGSCKKLVAARKQMLILQAPNILVIQLKRFGGVFGGKINKEIRFDEMLVLSSNICSERKDVQPEYSLFGTIVHSGLSPDSGHYYAYIKDASGRWYCCNDNCVTASTLQEVLSEKVYILFYSRTKQRPRASIDAAASVGSSNESNGNKTSKSQSVHFENSREDHISVSNGSSKTHHSNETGLGIRKPVDLNRVYGRMSSSQMPLAQIHDHDETLPNVSNVPINNRGRRVTASANEPNGSVSSTVNSVASVDAKDSSNLNSQACVSSHQTKSGNDVHPSKLLAHENIKFSIFKKESKGSKVFKGAYDLSVGGEKVMTKETPDVLVSTGLSGLQNGTDSVHSSQKILDGAVAVASVRNNKHKDLQNGNIMGSASNFGRKRKSEDIPSIFFACDDQSQAKLHDIKEMMAREASSVLRSCGWYVEVENTMRSRKKLLQEPGSSEIRDNKIKSELISHAKRNCLSKVPESLKASLVDILRKLNEEHKSAKA